MSQRFCNLCGQALAERYVTYTRADRRDERPLAVCLACDASAPRCRICGRPMVASLGWGGVCAGCLAERPRCAACGQPVLDGLRLQDGSQRAFCRSCAESLPRCLGCNAPVGTGGRRLADGRHRCPLCNATAIDDPAQAQQLYDDVCHMLAGRLGLELAVPTPLVPVDRTQLEAVLAVLQDDHPPEPRRPRGVYARRGVRRGIYAEIGLPRVRMQQVIAHELGHAWQAEHDPLLDDPLLVEGFAEWVAYKTMAAYGETQVMQHMLAREDVYGQGLRKMLAIMPDGQPVALYWRKT